jgi:hypothetical protein
MQISFYHTEKKNSVSTRKSHWLKLFRKIIGVNCENDTKHINTPCGEMQFLNVTAADICSYHCGVNGCDRHVSSQRFARNSHRFEFHSWEAYRRLYVFVSVLCFCGIDLELLLSHMQEVLLNVGSV